MNRKTVCIFDKNHIHTEKCRNSDSKTRIKSFKCFLAVDLMFT